MNKGKYDAMSAGAEEGRSTTTAPPNGPTKVAKPWGDFEVAGGAKMKAQSGHEVYKLTPEQLDAWRKAAGAAAEGPVGRGRQEEWRRTRRRRWTRLKAEPRQEQRLAQLCSGGEAGSGDRRTTPP